jgi:hypothetical protein
VQFGGSKFKLILWLFVTTVMLAPGRLGDLDLGDTERSSLDKPIESVCLDSLAMAGWHPLVKWLGHNATCSKMRMMTRLMDVAAYHYHSPWSPHHSLRQTNKGFKLLQKMGWKEGTGLGREAGGMPMPVARLLLAQVRGYGKT